MWCAGGHDESDHPDDRVHRSRAVAVPVIARLTRFEGERLVRLEEPAEFDVALGRSDGKRETWVYVGDGPGRSIEVTAESALRLFTAVSRVLADPG